MNITVTETNGKHCGEVRNGDRVVFRTPGYYTARMALSSAECWAAFHGKGNDMINPGDRFEARVKYTHELRPVDTAEMIRRVEEAKSFGLRVDERQGANGRRYIEIHNGKGSAYGHYFRVA